MNPGVRCCSHKSSPAVCAMRRFIPFSTPTSCFLNITFNFNLRLVSTLTLPVSFGFLFRNFVRNPHTTGIHILSRWALTLGDICWHCTFGYYVTKIKGVKKEVVDKIAKRTRGENIYSHVVGLLFFLLIPLIINLLKLTGFVHKQVWNT